MAATAALSSSFSGRALRPHKELLVAWTLLVLEDGEAYGYKLHHELHVRGLDLQATSLYRWLRKFERDSWVASRWSEPVSGPPRRLYSLTPEGGDALRDTASSIAAIRDTYSSFLGAHDRAVTQRVGAAAGVDESATPVPREPPADAVASVAAAPSPLQPLRPHRELLAGWLLLHLDAGATYGYDLRREFDAQRLTTDASAMYRMLRQLEADKWVQSRWMSPSAGPPRRFYRLTTRGRRNLDEIAALIGAMRALHEAFLRDYEREHRPPERAADAAADAAATARGA